MDVAIANSEKKWQVSNDQKGIATLLKELNDISPPLIAVEASGGLERPVVTEMSLAGLSVSIANPTRVRALARAEGLLAKTDVIDAGLITRYAKLVQPDVDVFVHVAILQQY